MFPKLLFIKVTDGLSRDGLKRMDSFELYKRILNYFPLYFHSQFWENLKFFNVKLLNKSYWMVQYELLRLVPDFVLRQLIIVFIIQ